MKKGRKTPASRANFGGAVTSPVMELNQAYNSVLEEIAGADLSDEEQEQALAELDQEYIERLEAMVSGDSGEDEGGDEDEEYSSGHDLATFSSGTRTGQAVLELGSRLGYEDIESLVLDLADETGLDEQDVISLLTGVDEDGEPVVVDPETAGALAELLASNEEEYNDFVEIANSDLEEYLGEEEGKGEASYSRFDPSTSRRIQELESQLAEFSGRASLNEALIGIAEYASRGVDEGWLPPVAHRAIMGNFTNDSERIASFSAVCNGNGVTPDVQLYAMETAIAIFEKCGPVWGEFGAMVEEPLTDEEREVDELITDSARAYAQRMNQD